MHSVLNSSSNDVPSVSLGMFLQPLSCSCDTRKQNSFGDVLTNESVDFSCLKLQNDEEMAGCVAPGCVFGLGVVQGLLFILLPKISQCECRI